MKDKEMHETAANSTWAETKAKFQEYFRYK